MKRLGPLLNLLLIVSLMACAAPTTTAITTDSSEQSSTIPPSEAVPPPNKEVPVVVLRQDDPNFGLVALFENHETIIAMTKTNPAGEIEDVTGAIFITPDGRSIAFYFEDGLPVRAIAEGTSVEFYNFTDSTVDIAVVAPDGTVTNIANIPFDRQKIHQVAAALSSPHRARPIFAAKDVDFDWMLFASSALGAFSCAATIATGGTLGILFGVSCGIFIYTSYFQITEKEPPLKVDLGDQGSGLVSCGADVLEKKYVMAAADCGKLILDASKTIQEQSNQTYQKQTKVLEEYNLKSGKKPIGRPKTCPNLSAEECINLGVHEYRLTTVVSHTRASKGADPKKGCRGPFDEMRKLDISFVGDTVTTKGVWWYGTLTFTKDGKNSYSFKETSWVYLLTFTPTGFTIQEKANRADPGCIWDHTFELVP